MKAANKQKKMVLNQDDIARLAWHIWQQEGCQPGRDEENWLKAEQLLMVASQPAKDLTNAAKTNAATARPNGSATKKNLAASAARNAGQFQPAPPAALAAAGRR